MAKNASNERGDITPTIDSAEPDAIEDPTPSKELAEVDDSSTDIEAFDDDDDLDSEDSLTFSNGVIEKIVALAVRDVPGVLGMKGGWVNRVQETFGAASPTKGVTVEVTPDNAVRVNVSVLIEYGTYAPQIFEDVKKAVVKQVSGMTGLEVAGVNLRIEDVLTPDEYDARHHGEANHHASHNENGESKESAVKPSGQDK
ncbi:Asp23/Gls24 family envelope stress response protein [Olsenella sp. Marseille-QA0557]|uniref:Asp23/Gls24 family envelope stress response protein n=1 Tax=Olsenella sp. Marseille-QA0557 TaxID=3378782 RepID=UPI003D0C6F0A